MFLCHFYDLRYSFIDAGFSLKNTISILREAAKKVLFFSVDSPLKKELFCGFHYYEYKVSMILFFFSSNGYAKIFVSGAT